MPPLSHASIIQSLRWINTFFSKLFIFTVWILTAVCSIATGLDIFLQTVSRSTRTGYQFVIIGSYALMALASLVFSFSRFITVRSALNDIPRLYVPITANDIPLRVNNLIQNELTRVNIIALSCHPDTSESAQPGWGNPGSALSNTHFRTAMIATLELVWKTLSGYPDAVTILGGNSLTVGGLGCGENQSRSMSWSTGGSIRTWMDMLSAGGVVDKRVAKAYVEGYEKARWSSEKINEKEYLEFMKLVSILLTRLSSAPS